MDEYQFAAFRSREQTIKYYEKLRAYRVSCAVINTPREASIGCGISVKYPKNAENTARLVLARSSYSTFIGFYEVTEKFGRRYVRGI